MKVFCSAAIVVLSLLLGSCDDPTSTSAALAAAVQMEGVVYTAADYTDAAPDDLGPQVASVVRLVDCSEGLWIADGTWVSDHCVLGDGESNFLAAGTPIFGRENGSDSLVAHSTAQGAAAWVILEPVGSGT